MDTPDKSRTPDRYIITFFYFQKLLGIYHAGNWFGQCGLVVFNSTTQFNYITHLKSYGRYLHILGKSAVELKADCLQFFTHVSPPCQTPITFTTTDSRRHHHFFSRQKTTDFFPGLGNDPDDLMPDDPRRINLSASLHIGAKIRATNCTSFYLNNCTVIFGTRNRYVI